MEQTDCQFASENMNMEINAEQVVTAGPTVTIFMATFCGKRAVAATQCSKGAIASLAAFTLGSRIRNLVLRADQETSLTALLDEIKVRRADTLEERTTAVEPHQSIGAVERMNRGVAGLRRTLKAALKARNRIKVALDYDFISWMIRHSAWLITRFRATHCLRAHQAAQVRRSDGGVCRDRLVEDLHHEEARQAGPALGCGRVGWKDRGQRRSQLSGPSWSEEIQSRAWRARQQQVGREVILEVAGCSRASWPHFTV